MIPVNDGINGGWHCLVPSITIEDARRRLETAKKDFQHAKIVVSFKRSKLPSGGSATLYNLYVSDKRVDEHLLAKKLLNETGWVFAGMVKKGDLVGRELLVEEKYGPYRILPMLGPGTPAKSDVWIEIYLKKQVDYLWSDIKAMPRA